MKGQRHFILVFLGVISFLLIGSQGIVWLARSSTILGNPTPWSSHVGAEAPSRQPTAEPDQLPEHPFEHMGVVGLSPSAGMPDNAIPEAQAIAIVTEYSWGPNRDELVKDYPASVMPAVYNPRESVMGPSAEERPVWVVTLEGWGPAGPCGIPGPTGPERLEDDPEAQPSSESQSEGEFIPGKSNAYAIVDAVSGQILGSWHSGRCGRE